MLKKRDTNHVCSEWRFVLQNALFWSGMVGLELLLQDKGKTPRDMCYTDKKSRIAQTCIQSYFCSFAQNPADSDSRCKLQLLICLKKCSRDVLRRNSWGEKIKMNFSLKKGTKKNSDYLTFHFCQWNLQLLPSSFTSGVRLCLFGMNCLCSFHLSEYGSHSWHVFLDFQTCCCKRSLANGMAPPPQPVSAHIVWAAKIFSHCACLSLPAHWLAATKSPLSQTNA